VLAGLIAILVVHAAMVIYTWGPTYWDFGDGNYMYIAKRMTEGVTLYKDILAPQPPLHLVTGAGLSALGDALIGPEHRYLAFRAFSLALRTGTAVLLFVLALRAFSSRAVALTAVVIWLFLPIGFWWQLGYQSEPLEILFLLLAVWGVWRMSPASLIGAGVASALAAHTNMTAVPYFLCNAVFLMFRRPRRLPHYLIPFLVVYFSIAFVAESASGGHFWDNVVFNQAGTFPRSDILARSHGEGYGLFDYVVEKVGREGEKILNLEGVLIAFAGVGIALWTRRRREEEEETGEERTRGAEAAKDGSLFLSRRLMRHRREYLAWTAIGHFLSIGFVAKGGTVDYIFTIGEPFVALFAAVAAVALWDWLRPADGLTKLRFGNTVPFLRLWAAVFVVFIALYSPARYVRLCLKGLAAELPAAPTKRIFYLIDHYSNPGDPLLTPPFYAVMTCRNVAAEYSENYIWTVKYMNERTDGGVGPGIEKAQQLGAMLEKKEIPLVILDMAQTARIPEVKAALEANYHQIEPEVFRTSNTQLTFWIPNDRPINHLPGWRQLE